MQSEIKKAVKALDQLVAIVAKETGALVMQDSDEDSVGYTLEGEMEMTFGHVRRAHSALASLEVALSTDAEPVCCGKPVHEGSPEGYTLECCGNFVRPAEAEPVAWILQHKKDPKRICLAVPNEPEDYDWHAAFPVYARRPPLYAEPVKTAPAVAVKDACTPDLLLYNLLMEAINEGVAKATDPDWTTKDFSKSPYYQDIHAALSAQVQDVAEASPAEYMRRHDAAIAAYEANTPSDSRYSALALRKAVDAAFAVAASPASKHGDAE